MLEPILDRWLSSLDAVGPAFSWFHLKFICVGATVTTAMTAEVISVSSTIPLSAAWSGRHGGVGCLRPWGMRPMSLHLRGLQTLG